MDGARLPSWTEGMRLWNPFNKAGYVLLGGGKTTQTSSRTASILKIAIGVASFLLLLAFLHPFAAPERYGLQKAEPGHSIPSIVHYVYIKKDEKSRIEFPFAYFLSLYASVLYVKPSKIYIHSDFTPSDILRAHRTGSIWTRKVLNSFTDRVEWNPIRVPSFAGPNDNKKIDSVQHKSDFIRWEQITRTGGIYLDWDVVPLRPLTALLDSGFAFVGGRHYGNFREGGSINGTINNGVFMTKPNSAMARIMFREQTAGFTGAWEYNLHFMTSVAERLVSIPGQVLITDKNSFAPTNWFPESKDDLFLPKEGPPSPEPAFTLLNASSSSSSSSWSPTAHKNRFASLSGSSSSDDVLEAYAAINADRRSRREWEMDWSASYVLHAFGQGQNNEWIVPKKILARNSNYGVATWEIVRHMVETGAVTGKEENWE